MADMLGILGRGNLEVIGAMDEGISGLIDSFREMGLAIGDDVIGKLDELGDQMEIIMRKWSLTRAELGWLEQNPGLV